MTLSKENKELYGDVIDYLVIALNAGKYDTARKILEFTIKQIEDRKEKIIEGNIK